MKKQSGGFIFFMTLCFILVMSSLLMICMSHVLLYHKALNQQEIHHQQFYQLEHLAQQLAELPLSKMNHFCLKHSDSGNGIIDQLRRGEGCTIIFNKEHYRYLIEDLGEFSCMVVWNKKHQTSTHHVRITMMFVDEENKGSSLLQLRMIKPTHKLKCTGVEHVVLEGISSWRYFSLK